ncbi:hypothetical protein C2845_PM17G02720 [Panicum miliaceum]|uniref:Uncharacterized protein n=1 Tax=Panicum miliaceum TaxID=4540 RepID=A0A3L6Q3K7_PANMI|nr:hypothetical protein C2845_PM17G02720 [Panicum miliaceum]
MCKANLNRLFGGADFTWHFFSSRGWFGDILLGINLLVLHLSVIVEIEFFIKLHLGNKHDDFKLILMVVYGPAQDEFKSTFLSELVRTCKQNPLPTLIGGAGLQHYETQQGENKNNFNSRWPFLFNAVIDSFDLREIDLSGLKFTWANTLLDPTNEKLQRFLMTTDWEFKYPMVMVQALDRGVSYHAPLLLQWPETKCLGEGSSNLPLALRRRGDDKASSAPRHSPPSSSSNPFDDLDEGTYNLIKDLLQEKDEARHNYSEETKKTSRLEAQLATVEDIAQTARAQLVTADSRVAGSCGHGVHRGATVALAMVRTLSRNDLRTLHPIFPEGEAREEFEDLIEDLDVVASSISEEVSLGVVISKVFADK